MENEHMGQMIASLRKKKNLTQQELADKLHITDKAVSKWERGLAYPDISLMPQLADILVVTTDALLSTTTSQNSVWHHLKTVTRNEWSYVIFLSIRCVGIAMAAGCLLMNLLGKLSTTDLLTILSISIICIGLTAFKNNSGRDGI